MNPSSVDIKDILIDNDSSLSFGTNIFISHEPETPDTCITILDTGGFDPDAAIDYLRPTIQIRSRSTPGGYMTAYSQLKTIVETLHGMYNQTKNNTRYIAIWQQGDIFYLGTDEQNRPQLTANFRIHRTSV